MYKRQEIECAYDPSLNTQSLANFEIRGWAVNKIKTTGMAQTSGDITGTIVDVYKRQE